jgi:baseplate J-like protein
MSNFGITSDGFVLKPLQDILNHKGAHAREVFGDDVDLRSTSALRKILDISSAADLELWKQAEDFFYGSFLSTASGDSLDLLGDDLGLSRRFLRATGGVELTLSNETPGRVYNVPVGTVVQTNPPIKYFRTLTRVSLSSQTKKVSVDIEALAPGPDGNVAKLTINQLNAPLAQAKLSLGLAQITVSNPNATTGGDILEDDESYRNALLGRPRTLWTLEAVRSAVKSVEGVRDCRLSDPLGGVDVSQSKFKYFVFKRRKFGTQRQIGTPFFFDVLVAVLPGFHWESVPGLAGVKENVLKAIDEVRPISIFPNLQLANDVQVGIRARILIQPGHDGDAVTAAVKDQLEGRVNALGLGNAVLYSQVMCDCKEIVGALDVQQLHLRRFPPLMGSTTFGRSPRFRSDVIEVQVGENINLQPDEIAVFQVDSQLIDIQVSDA